MPPRQVISRPNARDNNRRAPSLMGQENLMPPGPPMPPTRGMASYDGVRTGSFASFGHPAGHFGASIQVKLQKTRITLGLLQNRTTAIFLPVKNLQNHVKEGTYINM